ncbi:MAG: hypothetical protein SF123_09535 [Chloroflexota bacterium]|nr:hypothetical protein [Chloroflexota bacterium]
MSAVQNKFGLFLEAGYVIGSQEDGTAVANSDIDVVLVFKGTLDSNQRRGVAELARGLDHDFGVRVDFELLDHTTRTIDPALKLGGRLWFGSDVRDKYPLPPIEDWSRDRLHTSYWRAIHLFKRTPNVSLPLTFPSQNAPFCGYVVGNTTRGLVRHVSWAATALIAHLARRYVVRKSAFVTLYRELINDDWTDYLEQVYFKCKLEWNYRVPQSPYSLQLLCHQTLDFENHFMKVYRDFVLQELKSGRVSDQLHTLWVLEKLPLQDDELKAMLEALTHDTSVEIRERAVLVWSKLY